MVPTGTGKSYRPGRVLLHPLDVQGTRLGAIYLSVRVVAEHFSHSAAVVGLVMVQNNVVDLFQRANFFDIGEKLLVERLMAPFHQCGFLSPFYNIRVIGGTIFSMHHDVEHPHTGIHGADRINAIQNFYSRHISFSFNFKFTERKADNSVRPPLFVM